MAYNVQMHGEYLAALIICTLFQRPRATILSNHLSIAHLFLLWLRTVICLWSFHVWNRDTLWAVVVSPTSLVPNLKSRINYALAEHILMKHNEQAMLWCNTHGDGNWPKVEYILFPSTLCCISIPTILFFHPPIIVFGQRRIYIISY